MSSSSSSSLKPSTLADVAREAGVSPYTVSAVLNGARSNTRVSAATRQRILESAARLRYQPNAQARSLARQRSSTIGVLFDVVPSTEALGNAYASGILQGIVSEARARRYDVLLYTDHWQDAARSAARFRDRRTDGIIVVAPLTDSDVLQGLAATGVPLCAISANPEEAPGIACVDVDNVAGIAAAVEHLLSLGHRRIAHLTGNANVYSVSVRRQAFLSALASAGVSVPASYIVGCTYDAHSVSAVLPDLLLSAPASESPTAIVAGNDNLALAVLSEARRLGVRVPEDLSVVGFDDVPAASHVTPRLTTVRQPLARIGATAACTVMELMERAERTGRACGVEREGVALRSRVALVLGGDLVVRDSTAPAFGAGFGGISKVGRLRGVFRETS